MSPPTDASDTLTWSTRTEGAVAVVCLRGVIDRSAVHTVALLIARVIHDRPRCVLVDVSGARVEADGVALLVLVRRRVAREGLVFALVGASHEVHTMLDQARIAPLYRQYSTVPEAVTALGA